MNFSPEQTSQGGGKSVGWLALQQPVQLPRILNRIAADIIVKIGPGGAAGSSLRSEPFGPIR